MAQRFVLDASVALSWAFADQLDEHASRVLHRLESTSAVVPCIWPLEVGNALLVAERRKKITMELADKFLEFLSDLPILVQDDAGVARVSRYREVARKTGLSVYDSAYLYTAMEGGLPLATADKALARAAGSIGVEVL